MTLRSVCHERGMVTQGINAEPSLTSHPACSRLPERNIFKDSIQPSYRAESGGPVNLLSISPPLRAAFSLSLSVYLSLVHDDDLLSLETHSSLPIRYHVGRAVDETRAPPELYFYLSPRRPRSSSSPRGVSSRGG